MLNLNFAIYKKKKAKDEKKERKKEKKEEVRIKSQQFNQLALNTLKIIQRNNRQKKKKPFNFFSKDTLMCDRPQIYF